jgi:hypothetical protein
MLDHERELRINRVIYWLRKGVKPDELDHNRIEIGREDLPELLAIAQNRMIESERSYRSFTRKTSLGFIVLGIIALSLCGYLSGHGIPKLRTGRLLIGYAIGTASLFWGTFRLLFPSPKFDPLLPKV